jgi:hypothetical protein
VEVLRGIWGNWDPEKEKKVTDLLYFTEKQICPHLYVITIADMLNNVKDCSIHFFR